MRIERLQCFAFCSKFCPQNDIFRVTNNVLQTTVYQTAGCRTCMLRDRYLFICSSHQGFIEFMFFAISGVLWADSKCFCFLTENDSYCRLLLELRLWPVLMDTWRAFLVFLVVVDVIGSNCRWGFEESCKKSCQLGFCATDQINVCTLDRKWTDALWTTKQCSNIVMLSLKNSPAWPEAI